MAKKESTLNRFATVELPREKALKVKGGYRLTSSLPLVEPAPSFVGWGEIEIRLNDPQAVVGFDRPIPSTGGRRHGR